MIESKNEPNDNLEVEIGAEAITLRINSYTDFEEIDLYPDQVEDLMQQLGAWLGERKL